MRLTVATLGGALLCIASSCAQGQVLTTEHYFNVPTVANPVNVEQAKKQLGVVQVAPVFGLPGVEKWTFGKAIATPKADLGVVSWMGPVQGIPGNLFASVVPANQVGQANIPADVKQRIASIANSTSGPVNLVTFDGLTEVKLAQNTSSNASKSSNSIQFNADVGQSALVSVNINDSTPLLTGGHRFFGTLFKDDALAANEPASSPALGNVGLSYSKGSVFGEVEIEGKNYSIQPVGSGFHVLAPIDWKGYPEGHPTLQQSTLPLSARELPASAPEGPSFARDAAPPAPSCPKDKPPSIRIGFVFSPLALKDLNLGSINSQITKAWIQKNLDNLSAAFSTASVPVSVESAGAFLYTGREEQDSTGDLQWTLMFADVTKDPKVAAFRKANSADLIVFTGRLDSSRGCAVTPNDVLVGKKPFDPSLGYSLLSSYSTCFDPAYYSVVHEVGHQLGLAHDQDARSEPMKSVVDPEARGYAFAPGRTMTGTRVSVEGYAVSCSNKIQRLNPGLSATELAAIKDETCPRVAHWSNVQPDSEGQLGAAGDANSANVLKKTIWSVCAYKLGLH